MDYPPPPLPPGGSHHVYIWNLNLKLIFQKQIKLFLLEKITFLSIQHRRKDKAEKKEQKDKADKEFLGFL